MKKMITIMALVLGVAYTSQAAAIIWKTLGQQIYGPDNTTLAATGWAVQLVYVGPGGAGTVSTPGDDVVAHSKVIGDGLGKTPAIAPGSFAGPTFNYEFGVAKVGSHTLTTGDAFIIRVFNNATAGAGATPMYLDIDGGFTIAATEDIGGDSFTIGSAVGTTVGDWQPVPEPTSLALLGLGVAALALRRRLRK